MPKSETSDALKQAKEALEKQELELKTAEQAKKQREQEEPESPLLKAKADAEAQKSIDQAHQESAEAQQKHVSGLVPDLSKVTDKPLKVEGDGPLFGPSLAQRAAAAAAKEVAADVRKAVTSSARILVTDDAELATSDAAYVEVLNALAELITAGDGLIDGFDPTKRELAKGDDEAKVGEAAEDGKDAQLRTFLAGPLVGAAVAPALGIAKELVAAVPAALSLLIPQRTVSISATSADNLMAAAVVAGELSGLKDGPRVVHDDFRLLPTEGKVQTRVSELAKRRVSLVDLKLGLETTKATKTAAAAQLKAAEKAEEAVAPEAAAADCAGRIAVIDNSLAVIDKFTESLRTIATGQKYSPLVAAVLREQLHRGGAEADQGKDEPWFTHVLLVKTEPGSAQQLIDDRPFWAKDRFSIVATASVSYMLIETSDGSVRAGGSIGGQAELRGTFGKDLTVGEAKVIKSTT